MANDEKKGKSRKKFDLGKLLASNRARQPEDTSLRSSITGDTNSSESVSSSETSDRLKMNRPKLPNIRNHLKRLMSRFTGNSKTVIKSSSPRSMESGRVVASGSPSEHDAHQEYPGVIANPTEIENGQESSQSILIDRPSSPAASTSVASRASTNESVTDNGLTMPITITPPTTPASRTLMSPVNILEEIPSLREGAIISSDPVGLAAVLSAGLDPDQSGSVETRVTRREHESRGTPLYIRNPGLLEPYAQTVVLTDGNNFTATGSGSRSVSEVGETEGPSGGPVEERAFYESTLRSMALRKPLRHLDDEPPIY
ncbi:uncharacterized protein LOC112493977 [Cephus cinctus]|uniref:Uncharacterized protein LOC112493977 n=1 Tax=Cephus cinctus TaxID=211228 RepID=A0AAJ7RC93_CEPCN|nr:uncharacterized protein LOC112493977 [Cephus cinctus]